MQNLRPLEIDAASMFRFDLAADARMSPTDYADDQAWTVHLGTGERAAIAMQTQYGGRAGLVSLVPIWRIGQGQVYQQQSYHCAPRVTHFAANFLRVRAEIVPQLLLKARFWVMDSHAAGGEFVLDNHGEEAIELWLELFGHVAINDQSCKLNILTLGDYSLALHLGQIGNINPVVTMESAGYEVYGGRISSPKLGCRLTLEPQDSARIPFVVAGLAEMRDSHSVAMNWMSRPWDSYFERIDREAAAVPRISTGEAKWDRLIDLSYVLLLQSMLKGNDLLPHPSFVANRASNRGWSRRGDGSDHIRAWSGQDPTLAHLSVPVLANIKADYAAGIIRNYLVTQDASGMVDRQPGLAGQRQGLLMMPLLARMACEFYQRTGDSAFVAEVFPSLRAFFERWLQDDLDADRDGVPEWRSERQIGYVAFPTFGMGQGWAQGADVREMETPDLLAYLCSEAEALCAMARLLGHDTAENQLGNHLNRLQERLESFWNGSRYCYRDRDSHLSSESIELLRGGAGDEKHIIERSLPAPNRVAVRIVGGVSQRPRISLRLKGRDEQGRDCLIEADVEEFLWQNRQGIYTTDQALTQIDSIEAKGLSRVYKVYAKTIDSSRLDINHLLPLWTGALPKDRAAALVKIALDEKHFLRPNGITMVSVSDANFDASNARGGGGIWMFWLSLVGEGMVKSGFRKEATFLVRRVLERLSQILERDGHLSQFYHADELKGYGEDHHIGGIVPLKLLNDVIGIEIMSSQKVRLSGAFNWGQEIRVEQHGVCVIRNAERTHVEFPSGHQELLPSDLDWLILQDPAPPAVSDDRAEEAVSPHPEQIPSLANSGDELIVIDVDDAEASADADAGASEPAGLGEMDPAIPGKSDEPDLPDDARS